jgi:predicted MFS family arabinose efflux permease
VIALIPLLVWWHVAWIPLLCGLLFVVGLLTVLYQSADFALLPGIVTPRQLTDANAKLSASYSAAEISGRGLGGLLVHALTAPGAVLTHSFGYLVSAISLTRVAVVEPAPAPRTEGRLEAIGAGLRVAVRNPVLRGFLAGATTFNLFYEVFVLCVMLYLVDVLDASPVVVGGVLVAGGVGSLIGSWFGPKLSRRFRYGRVLMRTLALGNSAPLLVLLTTVVHGYDVPILVVVFLVMGIGMGISNAHVVTVRQVVAPPGTLGRLNAAYRMISWGAVPIGALLGGAVATLLGPWAGMVVGAVGLATATVWVAASPVRKLVTLEDAARFA